MKKESASPLYKQIYDSIKHKIDSGEYKVNTVLPSEVELQKEYNVSRITIRRALTDLEFAGLVRKVHGKGTFVEAKKLFSNLVGASSFSDEARKAGERASSIVLEFTSVPANVNISEFLQIELDVPVYFLKRLRLKNGRIVGINETYISQNAGLEILPEELDETTSIYDLYNEKGYSITRATETIEARMPSKTVQNELYMQDGEPVFLRERITYVERDGLEIPIEFSINTYRAEEYKYVINLFKG